MEMKEMMQSILEKIGERLNTSVLFGESREVHGKTLIPVSAIHFGFGFGKGMKMWKKKNWHEQPAAEAAPKPKTKVTEEGTEDEAKKPFMDGGGGGGGGGHAFPLGVFEVTDEATRFIPVICMKHILIGLGIMVLMMKHHR
jgi:uncharacterized spore protein YtfJ